MKQITCVTQYLWLATILLLCLTQFTQAVTTQKPKPLVQPTLTTTTTTVKPKQQQQQHQQRQDAKCLQPLETGPCRMSLERYYYNRDKNACETFKYGGCRGNDNRWGFRQTCEEACLIKK